jgi:membrane protein
MLKKVMDFVKINRDAFTLLKRTEPLILSSSTAFFTTFSLSPILILIVSLFGLYFTSEKISNQLFGKIGATVGYETAKDIQVIVDNFMKVETTWLLTTAGMLFFVFIATTLLSVVKINIHKLWRIRHRPHNLTHRFRERMALLSIVLLTGALIVVSVLIDSSLAISLDYLQTIVPNAGIVVIHILNGLFSLIVVTIWFTLIFKLLPEARVDWEVAFNGAFLTALLFTGGRVILGKILVHARIASIFGASASFALLLLFIFYSSFILYYGAAFTHEYAEYLERHICAGKHAHEYEEKVFEGDRSPPIKA